MKQQRSLTICLVLAMALGLGAALLPAQTARAQDGVSIGVVNVSFIISNCDAAQDFQAALNARGAALDQQYQTRQQEINVLIADLPLIPPDQAAERNAKEQEIIVAQTELAAWRQIQQQTLIRDQRLFLIQLYGSINTTVAAIAARDGLDLVLADTPIPDFNQLTIEQLFAVINDRHVVYRNDSLDITTLVLEQLNAQ